MSPIGDVSLPPSSGKYTIAGPLDCTTALQMALLPLNYLIGLARLQFCEATMIYCVRYIEGIWAVRGYEIQL